MKYVSTRGAAPVLGFGDVLLEGLARDGGLYVPEALPPVADASTGRYAPAAAAVMQPFVDEGLDLAPVAEEAYDTFDHPDVCPLVHLGGNLWLLELFHGPTLAFKDVALQLVGRLLDDELARRGDRRTIVVATSGDTGSAAIAACIGRPNLSIVVLHPAGRVSDVQRRQMTTVNEPNVRNLAVEGTFDDCQDLVKAMFADEEFRDRVRLGAMNSINWGRVLAQIPYYVRAAQKLPGAAIAVPTGNFGNVLAAWYARRMGAPISSLVIGSNRNDILARWVASGTLSRDDVVPTLSPAMDIQISSNQERLLFELLDRDGARTAELIQRFRDTGSVEAPRDEVFRAAAVSDEQTLEEIGAVYRGHGVLIDPHTAVGLHAAWQVGALDDEAPLICAATAQPAKFPDAVEQATGVRPHLPPALAQRLAGRERYDVLKPSLVDVQAAVEYAAAAGAR